MKRRLLGLTLGQILLVAWSALTLLPFLFIAIYSFRDNSGLYSNPLGVGGTYHPENYAKAWQGPASGAGMLQFFSNTGLAAVVALLINLSFGSLAAFYATRLPKRIRSAFLAVFLIGQVVPFVLLVVPYFQFYDAFQVLNNPAALGVAYGVLALPTTVLVLHSYYQDFPVELIEAATVDGLNDFAAYLRIVLPLSKGALTAVGILALIYVWGESQLGIVLLQTPASQTVTVGMLGFQGQFTSDLGPIFAGLSLASLPVIVIYLIFNRFITKGVALGGVFK